jgi:hypothetical protein
MMNIDVLTKISSHNLPLFGIDAQVISLSAGQKVRLLASNSEIAWITAPELIKGKVAVAVSVSRIFLKE